MRSAHFCGLKGGVNGGEGGRLVGGGGEEGGSRVGGGGGDADDDLLETDNGGDEFSDATLEIDPEESDNPSERRPYQVNDAKQKKYTLVVLMGFLRTLKGPPRGGRSRTPGPSGGFT